MISYAAMNRGKGLIVYDCGMAFLQPCTLTVSHQSCILHARQKDKRGSGLPLPGFAIGFATQGKAWKLKMIGSRGSSTLNYTVPMVCLPRRTIDPVANSDLKHLHIHHIKDSFCVVCVTQSPVSEREIENVVLDVTLVDPFDSRSSDLLMPRFYQRHLIFRLRKYLSSASQWRANSHHVHARRRFIHTI